MDLPREAELFERPNAVPVQVDLIPPESMPGRSRVSVVVVVPALSECEQRDPPIVRRMITRGKWTGTPQVRRGIDEPCGVQADYRAQKNAPEQERKSTNCEEDDAQHNHWDVIVFRNPNLKLVLRKIGNVTSESGRVVMHGLSHQNPTDMGPPLAIDRRVRIAFLVGELVMNAMRRHPEDWATFESQGGADRQKVFDPLRSFIGAMR